MSKKLDLIQYYQTDPKWKNHDYSTKGEKTTIGAEGCGTTCAAMVIATLADKNVTPITTSEWSKSHGFKALKQGTYYSYFKPQFAEYGIKCEMMNSKNVYHDKNEKVHKEVRKALEEGDLVIVVFGVGEYTNSGHYAIMQELDGDKVIIKDPWNKKPNLLKKNFDDAAYQVKYYWRVYVPEKYKEDDEVVENINIEVDGLDYTVQAINKDGYTYIKTRDIAVACGYDVSNKGATPILTKRK
jgi:predicted double-glycine peptidase